MQPILREHFQIELRNAQAAVEAGDFEAAWTSLQRAHILGQAYAFPHTVAHWEMLKLAWKQRDVKEIVGQLNQTVGAAPLSLLFGRKRSLRAGRVKSNFPAETMHEHSANVHIPEDLRQILEQASNH